jgi:hypothetical protein
LQTFASELEADAAVVVAAIDLAGRRCAEGTPSGHDSAAHHLSCAFRHVFVHAYDLTIDPEKLGLILKYAHVVRERIPGLVSAFVAAVADEQGLERPR